jgi:nucleolar protein 15
MDNYLLMGHILTCKVIPKDDVHPELWVGANRKWRVVPTYRLAQAQHNKVRSPASRLNGDYLTWPRQPRNETQRRTTEKRLMKRQEARKRKLAEAGVVYNFDKVGYVSGPNALYYGRSSFNCSSHRKNLKARRDNVEAMYFNYDCGDAPHQLFFT